MLDDIEGVNLTRVGVSKHTLKILRSIDFPNFPLVSNTNVEYAPAKMPLPPKIRKNRPHDDEFELLQATKQAVTAAEHAVVEVSKASLLKDVKAAATKVETAAMELARGKAKEAAARSAAAACDVVTANTEVLVAKSQVYAAIASKAGDAAIQVVVCKAEAAAIQAVASFSEANAAAVEVQAAEAAADAAHCTAMALQDELEQADIFDKAAAARVESALAIAQTHCKKVEEVVVLTTGGVPPRVEAAKAAAKKAEAIVDDVIEVARLGKANIAFAKSELAAAEAASAKIQTRLARAIAAHMSADIVKADAKLAQAEAVRVSLQKAGAGAEEKEEQEQENEVPSLVELVVDAPPADVAVTKAQIATDKATAAQALADAELMEAALAEEEHAAVIAGAKATVKACEDEQKLRLDSAASGEGSRSVTINPKIDEVEFEVVAAESPSLDAAADPEADAVAQAMDALARAKANAALMTQLAEAEFRKELTPLEKHLGPTLGRKTSRIEAKEAVEAAVAKVDKAKAEVEAAKSIAKPPEAATTTQGSQNRGSSTGSAKSAKQKLKKPLAPGLVVKQTAGHHDSGCAGGRPFISSAGRQKDKEAAEVQDEDVATIPKGGGSSASAKKKPPPPPEVIAKSKFGNSHARPQPAFKKDPFSNQYLARLNKIVAGDSKPVTNAAEPSKPAAAAAASSPPSWQSDQQFVGAKRFGKGKAAPNPSASPAPQQQQLKQLQQDSHHPPAKQGQHPSAKQGLGKEVSSGVSPSCVSKDYFEDKFVIGRPKNAAGLARPQGMQQQRPKEEETESERLLRQELKAKILQRLTQEYVQSVKPAAATVQSGSAAESKGRSGSGVAFHSHAARNQTQPHPQHATVQSDHGMGPSHTTSAAVTAPVAVPIPPPPPPPRHTPSAAEIAGLFKPPQKQQQQQRAAASYDGVDWSHQPQQQQPNGSNTSWAAAQQRQKDESNASWGSQHSSRGFGVTQPPPMTTNHRAAASSHGFVEADPKDIYNRHEAEAAAAAAARARVRSGAHNEFVSAPHIPPQSHIRSTTDPAMNTYPYMMQSQHLHRPELGGNYGRPDEVATQQFHRFAPDDSFAGQVAAPGSEWLPGGHAPSNIPPTVQEHQWHHAASAHALYGPEHYFLEYNRAFRAPHGVHGIPQQHYSRNDYGMHMSSTYNRFQAEAAAAAAARAYVRSGAYNDFLSAPLIPTETPLPQTHISSTTNDIPDVHHARPDVGSSDIPPQGGYPGTVPDVMPDPPQVSPDDHDESDSVPNVPIFLPPDMDLPASLQQRH